MIVNYKLILKIKVKGEICFLFNLVYLNLLKYIYLLDIY